MKNDALPSFFSTVARSLELIDARESRKVELYQHVHDLSTSEMSLCGIAQQLGLARNAVRKYCRQPIDVPPEPTPRWPRAS